LYRYAGLNPLKYIDPTGMSDDTTEGLRGFSDFIHGVETRQKYTGRDRIVWQDVTDKDWLSGQAAKPPIGKMAKFLPDDFEVDLQFTEQYGVHEYEYVMEEIEYTQSIEHTRSEDGWSYALGNDKSYTSGWEETGGSPRWRTDPELDANIYSRDVSRSCFGACTTAMPLNPRFLWPGDTEHINRDVK
jgi:hypothetical protein